jgi:toxin ParE1/3/4
MKIVFTAEAKRDLDELRAYLQPLSPSGLARVTAALEARIVAGAEHPNAGRPSPRPDVRELVETRYGFLIPYIVRDDRFLVLRVYRGKRKPLDYGKLSVPA